MTRGTRARVVLLPATFLCFLFLATSGAFGQEVGHDGTTTTLPPAESWEPRPLLILDEEGEEWLADLEAQLEVTPRDPQLMARLGILYVRLGRHDEGIALLEQAVAEAPGNPYYVHQLGRGLFGAERYQEVLDLTARLAASPRATPRQVAEALVLSGSTRLRLMDMTGAAADFDVAIEKDETYAPAHLNQGVLRMSRGNRSGALLSVRLAAHYAPDNPKIQSTLAQMLEGAKRTDDAFLVWKRVARLRPDDGDVQMKLAYYYLSARNDEEARPHLEQAVALNPDDGAAHYHLAELLTRAGEYDRAWDELLAAESLGAFTQYLRSRLEAIRAGQSDPYVLPESSDDPPREEGEQP